MAIILTQIRKFVKRMSAPIQMDGLKNAARANISPLN